MHHHSIINRLCKLLFVLLVGKVVLVTFASYRDYMPPNFAVDFLLGRRDYFWQGYHRAFYCHIVSGPISLLLGMILVSDRFRQRWPKWHRLLGKIQVACVLLVVAPSGLCMAWYAALGPIAGVGFATLAVATGGTVALGWRAAVHRRFDAHRRWMLRCFVLLCAAVVIRVNGGVGSVMGIEAEWYDIQTAWTSWLMPLIGWEVFESAKRKRLVRWQG